MNNVTRKQIAAHVETVRELIGKLDDCRSQLETVKDNEQEKYDNLPDNFRYGERGEQMSAWVDALDELVSALECVDISSAIDTVEGCE